MSYKSQNIVHKNPLAKSIENMDKNKYSVPDPNPFFGDNNANRYNNNANEEKTLQLISNNNNQNHNNNQSSNGSNKKAPKNPTRDYSPENLKDDQAAENAKSLREEIKDSKNKLKVITTKLTNMKKERDNYQKENKTLQEEVMTLQAQLRQMIPGFANTSSSFPMFNELINEISEIYKYDCEDIFFDLLCPELNMKGIILFFYTSFHRLIELVNNYFAPCEQLLKKTACINTIDGPIMNVLRKSYQSTFKSITKQCFPNGAFNDIINEIQNHLKLGGCSAETNEQIKNFLQKMGELILSLYISDPPIYISYKSIGSRVNYNSIKHEPLDGFIKNKEDCIVILPSAHKGSIDGEIVTKALVLQINYEIPN